MELDALLRDSLQTLLRELTAGPASDLAFVVNPGDPGLFGSLAAIGADDASRRRDGRSSVAAHVQHLRYGFQLLNRWARGDERAFADASYGESWGHQQVTAEQWRSLQDDLAHEVSSWNAALATPRDWNPLTLAGAISSIAHTAYHLGAIRQLVAAAAGPKAAD